MITDKKYCKCPYCGSECEVDTSIVLSSIPPQYEGFCEKCNKVIYTLCSNTYGKISMKQETSTIVKDEEYRNDIHRIADALEKIAKSLDGEKKQQQLKTTDDVRCPYCGSPDIEYTFGKTSISNETKLHYFCKQCHMEFNTDNKIEVKEMTDEEKEKLLKTPLIVNPSITVTNFPPGINSVYNCESCWWYQQLKANPNLAVTVGDTPCSWCHKMQPTCTSNLSSKN